MMIEEDSENATKQWKQGQKSQSYQLLWLVHSALQRPVDWFLRVRKKQSMVVLKNVFLLETRRKEVPAEVPAAFNVCSEAQVSAKQTPNKIETKKTILSVF